LEENLLVETSDLLVSEVVVHYKFLVFCLRFVVLCGLVFDMRIAIGHMLVGHLIVL
jgi:hypothetical protein